MRILSLALLLGATSAFAIDARYVKTDGGAMQITAHVANGDLKMSSVMVGGDSYTRIDAKEGLITSHVGMPEIPRASRWLAVSSSAKSFHVSATFSDPMVYENILVYPRQPDHLERDLTTPFAMNSQAYASDSNFSGGDQDVRLGDVAKLGDVTVLPVDFKIMDYNASTHRLTVYQDITIKVTSDDPSFAQLYFTRELTSGEELSVRHMVLNSSDVLGNLPKARRATASNFLIITTADLKDQAARLEKLHADKHAIYEIVTPSTTPDQIKTLVTNHFNNDKIEAMIIVGDETKVAYYSWDSNPSDSWYVYFGANATLAQLAFGRIPVATTAQADLIFSKLEHYKALGGRGLVNKNVLLVAHSEEYPGKYTANMEAVRTAANPRGYVFTKQYGGETATTDSVLGLVNGAQGYGIVNYRGHGSETEWWQWGHDAKSFDIDAANKLQDFENHLAVFFNIACSTGSFQDPTPSLAETMLLTPPDSSGHQRGAVSVLASTQPSYTTINDHFDVYLWQYLETVDNINIGNLIMMANNQLSKDNNNQVEENSKMYVLLGDPLLAPWVK